MNPRSDTLRQDALLALLLLALRLALDLGLRRAGFDAISDDDYARVVIAQKFAEAPSLDPSRTSWLPAPFWWTGAWSWALGSSLAVARAASEVLALASTALLFAVARSIGLGPGGAVASVLVATALPECAVLGAAMVPEFPVSTLSACALLALGRSSGLAGSSKVSGAPLFAGGAVFFAALSRYEAWPVAAVVAIVLAVRAVRFANAGVAVDASARPSALGAVAALAGPLLWIVHNRWAHGDALHFFRRVAAYRAALGSGAAASETGASDAGRYLAALASDAPALAAALAVVGAILLAREPGTAARRGRAALSRAAVPLVGSAALLGFLIAGAWFGGAPTHHLGRPLLPLWLLASVALGAGLESLARPALEHPGAGARVARSVAAVSVVAAVVLAEGLELPRALEGTLNRGDEVAAGVRLRARLPQGERVLLSTDDYGYFALSAALGRPSDAAADRTHDPRDRARDARDGAASVRAPEARLARRVAEERAGWAVVPAGVEVPSAWGPAIEQVGRFALYRVRPDAP